MPISYLGSLPLRALRHSATQWLVSIAFGVTAHAHADEAKLAVEVLLSDLAAPSAVVVQPATGAVLVADSGAGQILKLDPTAPGKASPLVTGFPTQPQSQKAPSRAGQLGLAMLDERMLIVVSIDKDGRQTVRSFELPVEAKSLGLNDAQQKLLTSSDVAASRAAQQSCSVVTTGSAVFVTLSGPNDKGSILISNLDGDQSLQPFERFLRAGAVLADAPTALTHKRDLLLSAQPGKLDGRASSSLAFFNARTGQLLMQRSTGLRDIVGLAYSPTSGRLYAVDFAASQPAAAGVYRLDAALVDGRQTIKAVKMAKLDRPTAIAFGHDNTAYVTILGKAEPDSSKARSTKRGALLKLTGDF